MDITDELAGGSPPTLARAKGVGVVQFSIARYSGGNTPTISIDNLQSLAEEFCKNNDLMCDITKYSESKIISVEAISLMDNEFVLVRHFTNGNDIVMTTHICQDSKSIEMIEDLNGVKQIMKTMNF
ncbi:hypothetical protein [Novosphingobium sp.]|uniref:hypothetical protein n=1 Tax=Novosphingobium sp. TaxID=1874826 RepID=UPI00286AF746|nr:hypothetical protein [Novosphingobium sp.]